ncbi:glycoside hydrolase family 2 TIM barrel-domain containing protein [Kiritimatiellaeota bacterium B1221]|nr:glycoside hydrolase family 2 TIM barrel-domain containing protein [Kiritimatiellaeota bacterium B1221]
MNTIESTPERIVQSLNGLWQLTFDPQNKGIEEKWYKQCPSGEAMVVPGVWELLRPGYDGVGWYEKRFELDAAWLDKRVVLKFGAVNYYCECWLNGEKIGHNEGGYSTFEFEISGQAKAGENVLVVRVINPPINHEIEGFRSGAPLNQGNIPVGKAGWYYNFGGIWQDVSLTVTERVAVTDCYVQPLPFEKKAKFKIEISNRSGAGTYLLRYGVRPTGHAEVIEKRVKLKKGKNVVSVELSFDKVRCWSPDDPFLYTAEVIIEGQDCFAVRFGMREFTVEGSRFLLNGEPIILKGFLQQGAYPRTLSFPEDEAMARREFQMLKENGFNFLRCHIKPVSGRYLDIADELGILVMSEPAIGWIMNSPETEARCQREVEALIRQDRNHPSVVFWCLLNEAFAFLGFSVAQVVEMTTRIARRARELDPSRLMIDTSGGHGLSASGGTADMMLDTAADLSGLAHIMLPNQDKAARFIDAHSYTTLPLSDAALQNYRSSGNADMVFFVSEYGAAETPPDYAAVLKKYRPKEKKLGLEDYQLHKDFYDSLKAQFKAAGVKKLFGSVGNFIEQTNAARADEMRLVTTALRTNPNLGGLCYCQLADASGELFGALDQWREPKPLWHALSEGVRVPLLVPEMNKRVLVSGETETLTAKLINENETGADYEYTLRLVNENGRTLKKVEGRVKAVAWVQEVEGLTFPQKLKPGTYKYQAILRPKGGEEISESMSFLVIEKGTPVVSKVGARGIENDLTKHLLGLGLQVELIGNNYREKNIPLLVDCRNGLLNDRNVIMEQFGQMKKMVQLGGCLILLNPEPLLLYEYLIPSLIRMQPVMRNCSYVQAHPVFDGLPSGCAGDYVYGDVGAKKKFERGADVKAAGGEVLYGAFSMHMWTRPADYSWGAGLYTLPLGKGTIVVSQLDLLNHMGRSAVADRILVNLINFAASQIKEGGEEQLLSRCIDPVDE